MSEKERPNLNAVGLQCSIIEGLEKYIRGKAGKAGMKVVLPLFSDEIQKFVNQVDESLNQYFGI